MDTKKPKIFVCVSISYSSSREVVAQALAEDGTPLGSHFSSGIYWAKHDMGITSTWKHEYYAKHYPKGFELEWVDNVKTHEGIQKALKLNKELGIKETRKPSVEIITEE